MTDNHSHLPPNLRKASEFKLRAKLRELLKDGNFLHATLNERSRVCGKRNCKCASGERHEALYLVAKRDGKVRQLYVHPDFHDDVRQWVANYQVLQQLINELSEISWQRVADREM